MIEYIESEPSSQTPRNRNIKNPKRQQRTPTNAQSRAKLALMRSKSKQNFLTDPQTSDHTQKSTSSAKIRIQILEQKLHKLHKQNSQLRQQIITMKANQFYTINQEKVKMAIQQNEKLRQEIAEIRKTNEQLEIQNEFLQRNNRNLKEKLEELTSTNLRKSVDASKSRMHQNTTRTINNHGEGHYEKMNEQSQKNIQTKNPLQYSSTKYQKRTIQHVKSNPNLMRFRIEQDSEFVSRQGQDYRHQTKNRKGQNSSNEHFLREFQKYQKQLSYNNSSNRNQGTNMYGSKGQTDLREQSHQIEEEKMNKMKMGSKQSRPKRSKSKQTSLQAILNRKNELMNRKHRHQQEINNYGGKYSKHNDRYRGENDQNFMGIGNGVSKQTFNEQYLIGKTTKYSSPNHRPNEYGSSKTTYRS